MSCYTPARGYLTPDGVVFKETHGVDIIRQIELPCGVCIGCRMRRASDWTIRVMHEASLYDENCFVTLTYGRDKLPANGNLEYRDFQLFMKRVRKALGPVRFFMCGEYGEKEGRPHYHACLFGQSFRADRIVAGTSQTGHDMFESQQLTALWGHGRAIVQDLVRETAGYCAKYIMKKKLGKDAGTDFSYVDGDGVLCYKEPEFSKCSLKPGIGAQWLTIYAADIYKHDVAIVAALKMRPPKYYDKLIERNPGNFDIDLLQYKRQLRAQEAFADNTDERRQVRMKVAEAKVRDAIRSIE